MYLNWWWCCWKFKYEFLLLNEFNSIIAHFQNFNLLAFIILFHLFIKCRPIGHEVKIVQVVALNAVQNLRQEKSYIARAMCVRNISTKNIMLRILLSYYFDF